MLLFGAASTALGTGRVRLALPSPCTARQALDHLAVHDARLRPFTQAGRLAVNHRFAQADQAINPGDEVALIAMVSGG